MRTPLYCRKCGTKLPPESQFCPTCGASQDSNAQSLTSRPASESSNPFSGSIALEAEPISPREPTGKSTDLGTGRLPPGRMLHQRYRLLHTVGQGGMGAVYVAQDTQLGDRAVAIKEMSLSRLTPQQIPQAVEQFKREAHLLAGLQHPNLPVIYEYFGEGDHWYLVMSFIQGGSLQSYLDAVPGNKLPVQEVVRIGIELCNVLEYLHTHQPQIIFRDLKPLNIMITPKGQIYLIDFGIARHFKQEQAKDTVYYYSVGYAPPEQYGQSQTGPRSDLYSLGATLHQMLTGHHPASQPFHFPALQLLDPTIPVPLANLIRQMLEMDEQQRPASAAVVKAELEKVLQPEPSAATRVEEARKRDEQKQEQAKVERLSQEPAATKQSGWTWQQGWDGVTLFFGKWRSSAWICFLVLSALLGVWGGLIVNHTAPMSFWFDVVGIGAALVGLAFLVARRRALVDILGGMALTLLADALLSYSIYLAYDDYWFSLSPLLLVCTSISTALLLLLGTRFFVRSANVIVGSIVGVLMSSSAGYALLILTPRFLYNSTYYPSHLPQEILQILLGIVVIVVTLLKRRRNKPSAQLPAAEGKE